MPRRCTICTHPKRDEMNKLLLNQSQSGDAIASRYGVSTSALDRHKANHLKLSAQALQDRANALTVVGMASDLYERAVRVLDRVERMLDAEGMSPRSAQAAAASLREVRGAVDLLGRLITDVPDGPGESESAWLDAAITEAVGRLALPALGDGIEEAVVVPDPPSTG